MAGGFEDGGASPRPMLGGPLAIVGIGASAGGLQAFDDFFRACPADTGMAFVLIPHPDPKRPCRLGETLRRCTAMPVLEATDRLPVLPDHVYVIPPGRAMSILDGALQLRSTDAADVQSMPIDDFLCSLAENLSAHAVGVILSGTADDGTFGLRAILGAGGVCLVEEPSTAKYAGMPISAAYYATHILPVDRMPATLLELTRNSMFRQSVACPPSDPDFDGLNPILRQIRSDTGNDFSLYRKSTISRRIERRMARHGIDTMSAYNRFLHDNPGEVQTLFRDLLINVTCFFRDPQAFAVLKEEILPELLAGWPASQVFRVWVAGCASGEEAYSMAMVLRELMDESGREFAVQIFATDLDDEVILQARRGHYPPTIARDLTPQRLHRFFVRDDDGYRVSPVLREMVIFAVHNVIKDPPFTRLDLLSCRNLMIYLESEQQARLIPLFNYALKPGGVLFLSTSEDISSDIKHPPLFAPLNRPWKLYRANAVARSAMPPMSWSSRALEPASQFNGLIVQRPGPEVESLVEPFKPAQRGGRARNARLAPGAQHFAQLENELLGVRTRPEAHIGEQRASHEELRSADGESRSSIEELQSANAALRTSKEELQFLNERAFAENARLNARIEQLKDIQNDLERLLDISDGRALERLCLCRAPEIPASPEGAADLIGGPLLVLDQALQVMAASQPFYLFFGCTPQETLGRQLHSLGSGQWDVPVLRRGLGDVLRGEGTLDGYLLEPDFPGIGRCRVRLSACRLLAGMSAGRVLLAIEPLDSGEAS